MKPTLTVFTFLFVSFCGQVSAQTDSLAYCSLSVTSTPDSASVYLDGQLVGWTPSVCSDITQGIHLVEIRKAGFVSETDTIDFDNPKAFFLDVRLIAASSLVVDSDPAGATVTIEGVARGETPVTLKDLSPGFIELSLVKSGYAAIKQSVVLHAGVESNLKFTLLQVNGELSIETFPDDAEVLIDSRPVAKGSLSNYSLPSGKYHLAIRNQSGEEVGHDVFVPPGGRIRLRAFLNEPNSQTAWLSAIVPGLGQALDGSWIKGTLFFGAFTGSVVFFINTSATVENLESDLEAKQLEYLAATGETEALLLRSELLDIHGDLESEKVTRALAIGGVVGFYALSLVDALLNHSSTSGFEASSPVKTGFRGPMFGMTSRGEVTCSVSFSF